MEYPSTWREDRRTARRGGFRPPLRANPSVRLPSARTPGGRSGSGPLKDFRIARNFALTGARVGARFIPWVGLGVLAVEVGWWYYNQQLTEGRTVPYGAPEGWKLENPNCHADAGIPKQVYSFAQCIGPVAFVREADTFPWAALIPSDKDILHRLYQSGPTRWKSVKWWSRDGSPNNQPSEEYVTAPAISPSPILPWYRFDYFDIPLHPIPQVVPDPLPYTPFPKPHRPRKWRSPTERTFRGPRRTERPPQDAPLAPRRTPNPRPRPGSRPSDEIIVYGAPRPSGRLRPKPQARPKPHLQRRPKRGERERKAKMKTAASFAIVRALFEQAFEAADYIDAIYGALPKNVRDWYERRPNSHTPWFKMGVIHKHYDLISIPEMIDGLMENEIEDFIFGLLGKASATVAQRLGTSVGPGFGQGFVRAQARKVRADIKRANRPTIEFVKSEVETFK